MKCGAVRLCGCVHVWVGVGVKGKGTYFCSGVIFLQPVEDMGEKPGSVCIMTVDLTFAHDSWDVF